MSDWLNYHHFYYFWVVAREGGLLAAGRALRVSHPTLSAQIRQLEEQLGEPLFDRAGRRLVLTDVGRVAYQYAEEIFGLGRQMVETIKRNPQGRSAVLNVGVADAIPKAVVQRLLEPALLGPSPAKLICREGSAELLVRGLADHSLDLVLSDQPLPRGAGVKAFNHLLGESGMTFFGHPDLVRRSSRSFPELLAGAPMVLPLEGLASRLALDHWLAGLGIVPTVIAECSHTALMKVLGAAGHGFFAAPTVIEEEVVAHFGVEMVGRTEAVLSRFYALTPERKIRNPIVISVTATAREELFASLSRPR